MELIELLFIEGSPAGIKAVLNILNLSQNTLRLPLVPVSRTIFSKIQKTVEEIV
jgi:4-hydroxy-tetrahydrodipicolinate synthase